MRVDLELLRHHAQEIRQALAILGGYGALSREEFLGSQQVIDASKYRLLVAIESAISICAHLASRLAQKTPDSYAQCFEILSSASILSGSLAERLGRMARFRNLLVHGYGQVDDQRVWKFLHSDVGDLEAYLKEIGHALKEQLA